MASCTIKDSRINQDWFKNQLNLDSRTFKSKYGFNKKQVEYLYAQVMETAKIKPKVTDYSSMLLFLNMISCDHEKCI